MSKWYVVWVGHRPGCYPTWTECEAQVKGFSGAKYKSYPDQKTAQLAYAGGMKNGPDGQRKALAAKDPIERMEIALARLQEKVAIDLRKRKRDAGR